MNKDREQAFSSSQLFNGFTFQQVEDIIRTSGSQIRNYKKDDFIFDQFDKPKFMFVLIHGKVNVGKDYVDGNESHMTSFTKPGDIFGEILLFLGKEKYDFYARSETNTEVLAMPRAFLTEEKGTDNYLQHRLIANTLSVFANKAYFLQRRIQVLSLNSLRKRIAKAILIETGNKNEPWKINRETLAGYVNAARPSVSRELSNMEKDELIVVKKEGIIIRNREKLEEISE